MGSLSSNDGEMTIASCTIKDVARLAEVSTATVSRVANGAKNVSRETKAKVLSVISQLRYCPNTSAAGLGRTNGGIPRKRGIHLSTSAGFEANLVSHREAERLRLMEDESARLRQLVVDLTREVEGYRTKCK